MKVFCLALDLKDDEELIRQYEEYHQKIWPEIAASIRSSGITDMKIFRVQNRLMMIMETEDDFSFERKSRMDQGNRKVEEWENLMWKYQRSLPGSMPEEKWRLMKKIFDLKENG